MEIDWTYIKNNAPASFMASRHCRHCTTDALPLIFALRNAKQCDQLLSVDNTAHLHTKQEIISLSLTFSKFWHTGSQPWRGDSRSLVAGFYAKPHLVSSAYRRLSSSGRFLAIGFAAVVDRQLSLGRRRRRRIRKYGDTEQLRSSAVP